MKETVFRPNIETGLTSRQSNKPMLTLKELSVRYSTAEVLSEIDIEVWQEEMVCLIGANGAGKTTLLRTISGLVPIIKGEIQFENIDLRKLLPYEIPRLGIGHVPQGRQIIPNLTVKENLELGCYRFVRSERPNVNKLMEREFARFPILGERRHQIASSLSGGEQQMLAISRTLMMEPKFIMMDEPSLGLAPLVVEEIIKAILNLHKNKMTILFVEQLATVALRIAHRGYVLKSGKVFIKGTCQELLEHPDIIKGYLGK